MRLPNIIERMSLRKSFFLSYIILLLIPLTFFGYRVYILSLNALVDNAQKNAYNTVKKNNEMVDVKLKQVNESIFSFIADEEIYKTFEEIQPTNDYAINLMDLRISKVLNKYFSYSNDIYSAQLATSYYTFFSRADKTTTSKNYIPKGALKATDIYKRASADQGKILWIPTYKFTEMFHVPNLNDANLEYKYLFSVVQMMNNKYFDGRQFLTMPKDVELPILIINLKEDFFRDIFSESSPIDGSLYYVLSEEGNIISHEDSAFLTEHFEADWLEAINAKKSGMEIVTYMGQKTILVYDESQVTHWMSVVLIPYDQLIKKLAPTIRNYVLILSFVLIGITGMISFFLSGMITKPVQQLSHALRKTGEGRFNNKLEVQGNIELRELIVKFNEMNENIQVLIRENFEKDIREKEAEILALNLQLDPHFMYNALNLINLLLLEKGEDEISELMENLSNMLKYTVKHKSGLVSFEEDMNFLKSYTAIMTKRYEGNFDVSFTIDERLYAYEVPKFLLQPFVENVFVHAYPTKTQKGKINVVCWIDGDDRYYCVEDDGIGMTEEKVGSLLSEERKSVGINNVDQRIKINYGVDYGITMESHLDSGTKVTIVLPLTQRKVQ